MKTNVPRDKTAQIHGICRLAYQKGYALSLSKNSIGLLYNGQEKATFETIEQAITHLKRI